MSYPALPEENQREYEQLSGEYQSLLHRQEYDKAYEVITRLLDKMYEWQEANQERYHKGAPLHDTGYTLGLQEKHKEALQYHLLAYIEDLLSLDNENDADSYPAGQTLIVSYNLNPNLLKPVKMAVIALKNKNRIPWDPNEVMQELGESYGKNIKKSTIPPSGYPPREFLILNSDWEKRVFIGGSGYAVINEMRKIIIGMEGYDPVVVIDFNMPQGMTVYHKCLALLHSCKYAVFELSNQGGQYIEIERAPDYGIKTLAVWQWDKGPTITQVLRSCFTSRNIEYQSYTDYNELNTIIRRFLP